MIGLAGRHRRPVPSPPEIWPNPPRRFVGLRPLLRVLRRLPAPLGEEVLAAAALTQGLLRPSRRRRARAWAASQPGRRDHPWRLACALLAYRGRFLAGRAQLRVPDLEAFRARAVIEGRDRLDAASRAGGVLLLGFHLGPLLDTLVLRAHGYRPVLAVRAASPSWDDGAAPWSRPSPADLVLFPDPRRHVAALYELRRRLLEGRAVYLAADGLNGAEAFRVPLAGGAMTVRTGWLTLRRSTGVPTLPVLGRREAGEVVLTVHPALPAPLPRLADDIAVCRQRLLPILEDYVRRYPAQCFSLALQPEAGRQPDGGQGSGTGLGLRRTR